MIRRKYHVVDGKNFASFKYLKEAKNYVSCNKERLDLEQLNIELVKFNDKTSTYIILETYFYIVDKEKFEKGI